MKKVEKILEEIEEGTHTFELLGREVDFVAIDWVRDIIRKHMNDGWIPVEERLPEDGLRVLAVIKHHKWIADYDSSWVPDCEKTQHPEYTEVCEAISSEEGWTYRCHEMDYEVDEAYIKPKRDIAEPISEVIAWRPLPEPYRPERCGGE